MKMEKTPRTPRWERTSSTRYSTTWTKQAYR